MIDDILKPKSEAQIVADMAVIKCPVTRFTTGFAYWYNKNPDPAIIPELIRHLRNPDINITVNQSADEIEETYSLGKYFRRTKSYPIIEIIVETRVSFEGIRSVSFESIRSVDEYFEYKRSMIHIQGDTLQLL